MRNKIQIVLTISNNQFLKKRIQSFHEFYKPMKLFLTKNKTMKNKNAILVKSVIIEFIVSELVIGSGEQDCQ